MFSVAKKWRNNITHTHDNLHTFLSYVRWCVCYLPLRNKWISSESSIKQKSRFRPIEREITARNEKGYRYLGLLAYWNHQIANIRKKSFFTITIQIDDLFVFIFHSNLIAIAFCITWNFVINIDGTIIDWFMSRANDHYILFLNSELCFHLVLWQ